MIETKYCYDDGQFLDTLKQCVLEELSGLLEYCLGLWKDRLLTCGMITSEGDDVYYVAVYPYESDEPGDLTFAAGEMVHVTKKDGDWWTGTIGARTGVFPSNYVQKAEHQNEAAADSEVEAATAAAEAAEAAAEAAQLSSVSTAATAEPASTNQFGAKRPNTAPVEGEVEVPIGLFFSLFLKLT